MILSPIVPWFSISAVLAVGLAVLYARKRRQERAVNEFSEQILRLTREAGTAGRIGVEGKSKKLGQLGSAVNALLEDLEQRGARLLDREQLFQRLVETVHDAVLVHRDRILFANSRFLALLNLSAAEVVGRPLTDFVAPEYADLVANNLRRRLAGEPAAERYEIELVGAQAQVTRVELSNILIDRAGEAALLLTALEMLPEAGTAVVPSRPRAMVTLDAMGESVITVDAEGRIDYINHAAETLLGQRFDQVMGRSFSDVASLVDETDRRSLGDPVRKALATGGRVTMGRRAVLVPANAGPERSVEISVTPLRFDGKDIVGLVLVLHDTSELRGLTRQMTYQASHDALTGLVNRREFERRLQEAMDSAQTGNVAHALCYLDLDRFKVVNDTCGHTAGDNMLREVASLVKEAVRDSDTAGRIGGDEFALLLVGCPLEKARQIADDVVRTVNDYRFVWKDKIFNIGVSIGLVEIGRDGGAIEDIMNSADSACYVAKKQGGLHVHVYSAREEASARHSGEIHWLQKLQGALRDNKFELYYQPIVHAQAGGSSGPAIEVFVRLEGENGQPSTPPSDFIRAAERYRLMPHIDRWVVQTVLSALGRGGMKLPPGRSVAINIAGQTLGDSDFLEFVVDCFDHTGANPGDICFEVTESSVVANLDHAHRFLAVLHGMGCEFALDDFGSGLSSFSTLRTLPMDYLKIDGSFIKNLAVDTVNQAMVAAMIELSRSLHFRVVAEQVEDQLSLDTVTDMGIDFVQGFAIGRPQPLSVIPNPNAVPAAI
ncbi:MAG TPA: EAL domain-containing protein [Steroidobacteraceae bacterium]|nr:EAL domain-containing protein [Steroidobacteraceae bacterium]